MKKEQQEFFSLLDEFRKLNIGSILPTIPNGEACILKAVRAASEQKRGEQSVRVADIIQEMQVLAPTVSRGLKSLEERGLVTRRVDEKDRRNTFVELTPEGHTLLNDIENIMEDFAEAVFQRVGTASFEQLNQSMRVLVNASREEIEKRKYIEKRKGE